MRRFVVVLGGLAWAGALLAASGDAAADADVCGAPPSSRFADVSGSVHEPAVSCLDAHDVVAGIDRTRYAPGRGATRAQMASFLVRTLELVGVRLADDHGGFADTAGNTHEAAIGRLASAGIVSGVGDGHFDPGGPVSRAQTAALLVRAVEAVTGDALSPGQATFSDTAGSVHREAIAAAAAAGLLRGVTADRFVPASPVRRDQMASMLVGLLGHVAHAGAAVPEPVYPEPDDERVVAEFEGTGSWYGPGFAGNETACGETFDPQALTAAHRELPCGTRVRITNLGNGAQTTVRINDRGPYADDRVIDVSRHAADVLGFRSAGLAEIRGEVLE